MAGWATPPLNREQVTFFAPTLDDSVPKDSLVRFYDELLDGFDWTEFENQYDLTRGQPPIHPRFVAGAILYGMSMGVRSLRRLEEATLMRIDFLWLLRGQRIDHTTFARFRARHKDSLKHLFRNICKTAMERGLISLGVVGFDATRLKADNARYATATAARLQKRLALIDAEYERLSAEIDLEETNFEQAQQIANQTRQIAEQMQLITEHTQQITEQTQQITEQAERIAELQAKAEKLNRQLERVQALDAQRRKKGITTPAQIPLTDSDSRVMPHKEGGYAPNYTPLACTDGLQGFIVSADVINEVNETAETVNAALQVQENLGLLPDAMLTDAGNCSGEVIVGTERLGINLFAPVSHSEPQDGNPAKRAEPRDNPVPESEHAKLPLNSQGKLDKTNFIYDAERDEYVCPQGRSLPHEKSKGGGVDAYRSVDCSGCPLAAVCVSDKNNGGRTISRDQYVEARDRLAERMASEAGKKLYRQRPRIAETPFAIIKSVMGMRKFSTRGLENVKVEWNWIVSAFNLRKLARLTAQVRAAHVAETATTQS